MTHWKNEKNFDLQDEEKSIKNPDGEREKHKLQEGKVLRNGEIMGGREKL